MVLCHNSKGTTAKLHPHTELFDQLKVATLLQFFLFFVLIWTDSIDERIGQCQLGIMKDRRQWKIIIYKTVSRIVYGFLLSKQNLLFSGGGGGF
jgi:hypothetical protein